MDRDEMVDYMEKSKNSATQANDAVVRSLQISVNGVTEKLSEVLDNQLKQEETSEEYREIMIAHIKRVEPMLKAYETDVRKNKIIGEITTEWSGNFKRWGAVATAFTAIVAAVGLIIHWAVTHLKL